MKRTLKVLIVEDEARMRRVLIMLLSDLPIDFVEAEDGHQAFKAFDADRFDLVITDLRLPKANGMEVLSFVKQKAPELPVIVITAFGSIENAVSAIQQGAFDYVTKPFKEKRLRECVDKALHISRLTTELHFLRREIESKYNFDNIIGDSQEICDVLKLAGEVARTDASVLITGESGTGKELLSRAIHYNSPRARGPFLPVNCAAIPSTLLEAELFGYEKGAFTGAERQQKGKFELASSGTLFLDEIGDMGLDVQAKLLRIMEGRSFERLGGTQAIQADVRIVAATNRNLKQMVEENKFRDDLFYRIHVFPIHIPPLRKRRDDILPVADFFIHRFCQTLGRKNVQLTPAALTKLKEHRWNGNIRELKNVIERAMILSKEDQITSRHLILNESPEARLDGMTLDQIAAFLVGTDGIDVEDLERHLVRAAMASANQNVTKAARLLRLTRPTLRYRLERLGIS